ncbi:MAG: amidohydrolase family protein [Caldilineales bacterium]|nr:amidohydrolase family protein [Caldilineales bacterium]MCW5857253.1 amidohydrolase family protein [Caldilineales bacterium]
MPADLVIHGGVLIDPAHGIYGPHDLAITGGRVSEVTAAAIPPTAGRQSLDARGLLVTPGLIDLHAHVAETIIDLGVAPDRAGVQAGVTTVVDAGSTGYATFAAFRRFVLSPASSDVFCFLHLSPVGEAVLPEVGYQAIDQAAMLAVIDRNREVIKGIKLRAVANVIGRADFDAVATARALADAAGLPLMVHLGIGLDERTPPDEVITAFLRRLLAALRPGDILTHVYTPKPGGVIGPDGATLPEFRQAVARGVLLDVAAAAGHLSFETARAGLAQGLLPTTLSTDITSLIAGRPHFASLTVLMSKFLALGLSLEQVVAMTTLGPARALNETHRRGSLGIGMPADITLLERLTGEFVFADGRAGHAIAGREMLIPRLVIKAGVPHEIAPDLRDPNNLLLTDPRMHP